MCGCWGWGGSFGSFHSVSFSHVFHFIEIQSHLVSLRLNPVRASPRTDLSLCFFHSGFLSFICVFLFMLFFLLFFFSSSCSCTETHNVHTEQNLCCLFIIVITFKLSVFSVLLVCYKLFNNTNTQIYRKYNKILHKELYIIHYMARSMWTCEHSILYKKKEDMINFIDPKQGN